jgi:hypothetical protein
MIAYRRFIPRQNDSDADAAKVAEPAKGEALGGTGLAKPTLIPAKVDALEARGAGFSSALAGLPQPQRPATLHFSRLSSFSGGEAPREAASPPDPIVNDVDGGDLVLEAPAQPSAAILDLLSRHKAGLVELLQADWGSWSAADWRAFFDERAGIAEFDAGLSRTDAERRAYECCVGQWLIQHPVRSEPGRCLNCGGAEKGYDALLAFGTQATGHAWLHVRCWEAWYAARKAKAVAALAAMGIEISKVSTE